MSHISFPPELLDKIFDSLVEVENKSYSEWAPRTVDVLQFQSKKDLLSCALTCRAFLDPAMRILWHTVQLIPLLELLPGSDLLNTPSNVVPVEIDEVSIQRVDSLYFRKVKRLVLSDNSTGSAVHSSVYHRLALVRPRPLPHLAHIFCFVTLPVNWEGIMFLISPLLESATFSFDFRPSHMRKFLSLVEREAPMLKSLAVFLSIDTGSDLVRLSQLRNLRVLHLSVVQGVLDSQLLVHLDRLEDLRVEVFLAEIKAPTTRTSRTHTLRRLHIGFHPINSTNVSALEFLDLYQESPVESFTISGVIYEPVCRMAFDSISGKWAESLTSLIADCSDGIHELRWNHLVSNPLSSLIESLYALSKLQVVRLIGLRDSFCVVDDDISNMSRAWPNITEIELDAYIPAQAADRFHTVASFYTFSKQCPRLESITLPFSVPNSDSDSLRFDNHVAQPVLFSGTSDHKLKRIVFNVLSQYGRSRLEDSSATMAYHLDMAFPFLRQVQLKLPGRDPDSWESVNRTIEHCQSVRRERGIN